MILLMTVQYDLFFTKEECERDALDERMEKVEKSADKVRRKLFAENGALKKMVIDLSNRLEIIERNLCQGQKTPEQPDTLSFSLDHTL